MLFREPVKLARSKTPKTMLRYSLILLLVNIYGRSLGGPVPEPDNGKILIGNLLNELSKQCKNEFVLSQIENKKSTCDVEMNYHVTDLQCLMFFDANSLLCNLTANITADFPAKIAEKQNASAFCNEASHFTMLSSKFHTMLTTVFQSSDHCTKVCASDDIRTDDANFFCKYYKWTLLKFQAPQSSVHASAPTVSTGSGALADVLKTDETAIQGSPKSEQQVPKTSETADTNTQLVKVEDTNQQTLEVSKQGTSSTAQVIQSPDKPNLPINANNTTKSTVKPVVKVDTAEKAADTVPAEEPIEGGIETGIDNNPGENKDPDVSIQQIETPKRKIGVENEELEETGMDMDEDAKDASDDGDDIIGGDLEVRQEQEAEKPPKRLESHIPLNGDGAQRDILMGDGFTEDDHFFPFFLTAVIVVVVLYVFYHNKNKVAKMFFGLIVEGRQPGRRRNSRGHAYRRLDTLEQAMSASAPAPPSKIIY